MTKNTGNAENRTQYSVDITYPVILAMIEPHHTTASTAMIIQINFWILRDFSSAQVSKAGSILYI